MTDIQDRFCPKCGKPSKNNGLCNLCLVENTPWVTCDNRVTHIHCPSCGATKTVNTWTDTSRERADMAPDIARSAAHFHKDVKKAAIAVDIRDISINRSRATLSITGMLYGEPVEKTCTVEIVWQREQCDRCNRISGSYYEGLVQVRADDRDLSPYEMQTSAAIATQIEDTLQASGERLSFISDMNETRDGLDITLGSQHIGVMIVQAITAHWGEGTRPTRTGRGKEWKAAVPDHLPCPAAALPEARCRGDRPDLCRSRAGGFPTGPYL